MNVEKIQKLIRLLSSDNDGEALATLHALKRTLKAEGADIHELAKRIEGISEAEIKKVFDTGFEKGKSAAAATANFTSVVEKPSFYQMACEIQESDRAAYLSEKEINFVDDMVRLCSYREPSEKQGNWLHAIYCKIGRRR